MILIDEEHGGYTCGLGVRYPIPQNKQDRRELSRWCGKAMAKLTRHMLDRLANQSLADTQIDVSFTRTNDNRVIVRLVAKTSRGELFEREEVVKREDKDNTMQAYVMAPQAEVPLVYTRGDNED